jgi:hypothetical protein
MKAPSSAQYLKDLAAKRAGPAELRPTDIGSMISNGGQPPPAALAHNEPPREPTPPLILNSPFQLDDGAVVFEGELGARPRNGKWLDAGRRV